MVRKTYTSELRRGPDPAPGRAGEGPRELGRTCARPVFCLENSMSAHKKYSNFFLRQDFCLIFFVGKLWTCSIHFSQNKRFRSSAQKYRAPNVPHGAKIKKINTFPTQFNRKIVRPPKKVRKNENFQTEIFLSNIPPA